MANHDLTELTTLVREFAVDRDWAQFHTPKNLAMALAGEAGELLEVFQWLTAEQAAALSPDQFSAASLEMADVLIYLVRLADVLGVDLLRAAFAKVEQNARRYPISAAYGSALKAPQQPAVSPNQEDKS